MPKTATSAEIAGARGFSTADAKAVYRAYLKLRKKHGTVTAEAIIKEASNPRSALHKHFTWNEGEAAREWRLYQARKLLAHVLVILETSKGPRSMKALMHVPVPDGSGKEYVPVSEVAAEPLSREYIVEQARRDAERFRLRYSLYRSFLTEELAKILEVVEESLA